MSGSTSGAAGPALPPATHAAAVDGGAGGQEQAAASAAPRGVRFAPAPASAAAATAAPTAAEAKREKRVRAQQTKMFNVLLESELTEQKYRVQFRADVARRVAAAGGWGIDFDTASASGGADAAGGTTAAAVDGMAPVAVAEKLELPGAATPIRVLDGAVPPHWCDQFIRAHTEAGFVPQSVLDATVGSPQAIQARALVKGVQAKQGAQRQPQQQRQQAEQAGGGRAGGGDAHYQGGKNTSEVAEVVSPELAAALWARLREFVPPEIATASDNLISSKGGAWHAVGIIPVFRFMRYRPGQAFKAHTDPARLAGKDPATGAPGRFKSLVTLAMYLNDASEFEGGGLHFVRLVPNPDPGPTGPAGERGPPLVMDRMHTVVPRRGRCVVFEHRRLHEAETVAAGIKHMVQCDVLYQYDPSRCG